MGCSSGVGAASTSVARPSPRVVSDRTTAQTPKEMASTATALAAPIVATRPPAIAAPTMVAPRSIAEPSPVTRS